MVDSAPAGAPRSFPRCIRALTSPRRFDVGEEIANAITHGVACLGCIAVAPVLITAAAASSKAGAVVGMSVFAGSKILLYLVSCLYHALAHTRVVDLFERLDHIAIYLLIAGSYTPFCLAVLPPTTGAILLGAVWSLALAGTLLKAIVGTQRWRLASLGLYLLMGWAVIPVLGPLVEALPAAAVGWLVAGGVAYTVGALFFLAEQIRFGHMIWHLLVVLGTACHVVAMFFVP